MLTSVWLSLIEINFASRSIHLFYTHTSKSIKRFENARMTLGHQAYSGEQLQHKNMSTTNEAGRGVKEGQDRWGKCVGVGRGDKIV